MNRGDDNGPNDRAVSLSDQTDERERLLIKAGDKMGLAQGFEYRYMNGFNAFVSR